jgi:hypothetical protein
VQVIDVVTMRDLLVVAVTIVATIAVSLITIPRIGGTDGDRVLVVVARMLAMQAPVVDVVDVALMLNACVAARRAVDVVMIAVDIVLHDEDLLERRERRTVRP